MACPMPREAPVTSAISFSSMGTPSGRRECGLDAGRVLQRQKIQVRAPLDTRSEEHTSELQSPCNLVCRLLLEKKKTTAIPLVILLPLPDASYYPPHSFRSRHSVHCDSARVARGGQVLQCNDRHLRVGVFVVLR